MERNGQLNPMDRDELRNEYQASKTTSPVHPDPESARDMNTYFPKSNNSSQTGIENPARPIWMRDNTQASGSGSSNLYSTPEANASTDTVTQENFRSTNTDNNVSSSALINTNNENTNLSPDITASEVTPLTTNYSSDSDYETDSHTYPPRPKGKERVNNYFPGLEALPFARGFRDDKDVVNFNEKKEGKLFLSSRFLSKVAWGKSKATSYADNDNFNGDWDY